MQGLRVVVSVVSALTLSLHKGVPWPQSAYSTIGIYLLFLTLAVAVAVAAGIECKAVAKRAASEGIRVAFEGAGDCSDLVAHSRIEWEQGPHISDGYLGRRRAMDTGIIHLLAALTTAYIGAYANIHAGQPSLDHGGRDGCYFPHSGGHPQRLARLGWYPVAVPHSNYGAHRC